MKNKLLRDKTSLRSIAETTQSLQRSDCERGLSLQSKVGDEFLVRVSVFALQVLELLASISNELKQSTAGVEVFLVRAKVSRQLFNLAGKEGNLCLG